MQVGGRRHRPERVVRGEADVHVQAQLDLVAEGVAQRLELLHGQVDGPAQF